MACGPSRLSSRTSFVRSDLSSIVVTVVRVIEVFTSIPSQQWSALRPKLDLERPPAGGNVAECTSNLEPLTALTKWNSDLTCEGLLVDDSGVYWVQSGAYADQIWKSDGNGAGQRLVPDGHPVEQTGRSEHNLDLRGPISTLNTTPDPTA